MHRLLSAHDRNRNISATTFDYYRCAACGLISLSPVPDDLGRYYPSDYIDLGSASERKRLRSAERYKLDLLLRVAERGRVLEIGPGAGGFLELAQTAGFEVEAVEQDEACCRYLESVLGVRTYCTGDPVSAIEGAGQYAVIALWHSLEHLAEPDAVLGAAASALSPGGAIMVATPNPHSLQFRLLGSRWTHLDAPRHLHLIPPAVMRQHAARLGLRRCTLMFADEGTRNWNAFGWRNSIRNGVPPVLAEYAGTIGRVIGRLMKPVERRGTRASTYTAILQP